MLRVRIHGRGGQGAVTAAEVLSVAAFLEGHHAQAFPSFGSERTGAPVVAFCRIDDRPIRSHEPIVEADVVIVQDPTLLQQVDVFDGLREHGYVLLNSTRTFAELELQSVVARFHPNQLLTVPATELALSHLGRAVPNAALLGGFAAITDLVSVAAIARAFREKFFGKVADGNVAAAAEAHDFVRAELIELGGEVLSTPRHGQPFPRRQIANEESTDRGPVQQLEGSRAVADTVARCRPEVICAYPISPQTHIVEALSATVKSGVLQPCEFVNVESEFAAMSVAIGASATGARAYTATASQGLLYMVEAVYNASGLGLPIVMTVANRAIGAPINIWNDHSDSMSQRDSGWIQLYAESTQQAVDLHIQAFRLAEAVSLPVMVCMDGFVLTHAYERISLPTQQSIDAFLPAFEPRQVLDPADPVSIGAMVGPEAFTEVRYLAHLKQLQALELIPRIAAEFTETFGRRSGNLISSYRTEDAQTIIVALGSVLGAVKDAVDELRAADVRIGVVSITAFRPFPHEVLRSALENAKRVVVIERAFAVGIGGIVSADVRTALSGMPIRGYSVIAGLGGRAVTKASLLSLFDYATADALAPLTFLDLDQRLVEAELARMREHRRSGPTAENVLRDIDIATG